MVTMNCKYFRIQISQLFNNTILYSDILLGYINLILTKTQKSKNKSSFEQDFREIHDYAKSVKAAISLPKYLNALF